MSERELRQTLPKTGAQRQTDLVDAARELRALLSDRQQKTFAVKSLVGQRARWRKAIDLSARLMRPEVLPDFQRLPTVAAATRAQFFQEVFAFILSDYRREGFFVEFGACEGLSISNTYSLETDFGWHGILAEPAPTWHADLRRNRKAAIETRCVWKETGAHLRFYEDANPLSSTAARSVSETRSPTRDYTVDTVSLLDMLKAHQAPAFIDYLSVDTEGTEPEILASFDFSQYAFGFITVEVHPEDEAGQPAGKTVRDILEAAGYVELYPREPGVEMWSQVSGFDRWFVPAATYRRLTVGGR